MVARDFGRGTAHVDVDDVGTEFHRQPGRLSHQGGIVPEKLHRGGTLPLVQLEQLPAFGVAEAQPLAAHHFADHIGGAVVHAQAAEGAIRHPRHGRQCRPALYLYLAYPHTNSPFPGGSSRFRALYYTRYASFLHLFSGLEVPPKTFRKD